jgi:hypothetical protein
MSDPMKRGSMARLNTVSVRHAPENFPDFDAFLATKAS